MIDEVQRVFIAAADYTDECRVDVRMRRKHMDLSASQARQFARELMDAAYEADRAASGAVRPVEPAGFDIRVGMIPTRMVEQLTVIAAEHGATVEYLSPDCKAGKHPLYQDEAWNDVADVEVPCTCPCHTAPKETAA